jgi:hypothetical protein
MSLARRGRTRPRAAQARGVDADHRRAVRPGDAGADRRADVDRRARRSIADGWRNLTRLITAARRRAPKGTALLGLGRAGRPRARADRAVGRRRQPPRRRPTTPPGSASRRRGRQPARRLRRSALRAGSPATAAPPRSRSRRGSARGRRSSACRSPPPPRCSTTRARAARSRTSSPASAHGVTLATAGRIGCASNDRARAQGALRLRQAVGRRPGGGRAHPRGRGARCRFDLGQLRYRYPARASCRAGATTAAHLRALTWAGARGPLPRRGPGRRRAPARPPSWR